MSPPGIPSSPSDVRLSLASAMGSTKKSKAKVKAKEVKKEVRLGSSVAAEPGSILDCCSVREGKQVQVLLGVLKAKA